jgi:integrase
MSKKNAITAFPTLEPRIIKKTGLFPVSLIIYCNGKRKRYRTKFELSKEQWTKIRSPKLKDIRLKDIREKIQELTKKAENIIDVIENENIIFSFEEFENRYFEKIEVDKNNISYSDCTNKYIIDYKKKHKNKALSIKTIMMYKTVNNSLNRFKKNIKITQITPEVLNKYEAFLKQDNKSISTISIYLRQIRAIVNFAINEKYLPPEKYPFKNYEISSSENKKRALNDEQLKELIYYKSNSEAEQKALDFWIFSYLGNGINFSDIARLRNGNIKGEFINFVRQKTKNKQGTIREIEIYLHERMKTVINKYGNQSQNKNDYIFPILEDGMNPEKQLRTIEQFIKTTNKYLKRISLNLHFDFHITTYWARHSWATKLRNSNVSISYIKEHLGHSRISTTENYLDKFPANESKEIADKLLDL